MLEAVDRITTLHDPLLHHILSFLEIKDVARTSVLSKRWREIWKSVPILDFLSLLNGDIKELPDIVDTVLHLHYMDSSIHKLSLCCSSYKGLLEAHRVNLWIKGAIMRKVKELRLTLKAFKDFCPESLFTCRSLITLELNASRCNIYIPKHISMPKLRHLRLYGVKFSYELLSLSNCPVLEDLTLEYFEWVDVRSFCISSPSVEHLKIINDIYGPDHIPTGTGLRDGCLKIHAPRLASLTYKDSIPKEFVLCNSSTLADADVDELFFRNDPAVKEQRIGLGAAAIRFLRVFSRVKILSIHKQLLMALSFASDLNEVLPTFNNLKQLKVSAGATYVKALVDLLQSAPNLESLVIRELAFYPICYGEDFVKGDDGLEPQIMTTGCCFLHLKAVCFEHFKGHTWEMWWVKLFLEKAKALQSMTISHFYAYWSSNKNGKEVMAELSSLFRASATSCVLNFLPENY